MNKKGFVALLITILFSQFIIKAQDADPYAGIIPAPVSLKKASGQFVLGRETQILADTVSNKAVLFFTDYLANSVALSIKPKSNSGQATNNSIILTSAGTDGLPAEG